MTYVVTARGQRFDLINPDPAMVDWDDVAARLHRIPRYAGTAVGEHIGSPVYEYGQRWSVAQHTMLVAALVASDLPRARLHAVLHDAHEAYLGDWITPVKQAMSPFGRNEVLRLERRLAGVIHARAGMMFPEEMSHISDVVRDADVLAYAMEVRHLIAPSHAKEFFRPYKPEGAVEQGRAVIEAIASTPDISALLADTIRKAIMEAS